ncbi:MAG: lysine-sensitive aspartokinase 3 [Vicinamibacteria bacterium]
MSLVLKFGGSSVGDAACIKRVAEIARGAADRTPVVVVSAMGKTTDTLFNAAQAAERGETASAVEKLNDIIGKHHKACAELWPQGTPADLQAFVDAAAQQLDMLLRGVALLRELSARSRDAIVSWGELLSSQIVAAYLASLGVPTAWLDVRRMMRTDAKFGSAEPQMHDIKTLARTELLPLMGAGRVVVTQGYIGATKEGITTTLGRGGSDYSASLIGAAIVAREVQIWTDVEGVLTADPRMVPEASPILELSFREAAELAAFGAKVLHPATIQPAVEADIPVTVRHTMRPEGKFSTITASGGGGSTRPATAIASRSPIQVITIESSRMLAQSGFLARIFEVFGRLGVPVDVVATAEVSVSLTVEANAPIDAIKKELNAFAHVEVATDRALVALVGERLKHTAGLAGRVFGSIASINVEMISMGSNEINLSLVVERKDEAAAVRLLHQALFAANGDFK